MDYSKDNHENGKEITEQNLKHKEIEKNNVRSEFHFDRITDIREVLATIFNSSSIPVLLFDKTGTVIYSNPEFEKFINIDDDAEQTWILFNNDYGKLEVHYSSQRVEPNIFNQPLRFSGYFVDKNNNKKTGIFSFLPIISNNEYLGAKCIITDVDSFFSATSNLINYDIMFEVLLNRIEQAIVILDSNRKVIAFNKSYWERFGYNSDIISVGVDFEKVIRFWGKVTNQPFDVIEDAIKNVWKNEYYSEEFLHQPEGEPPSWYRINHHPLPDGKILRTYYNITDIKLSELNSKQKEENFNSLYNSICEMLFVIDFNGTLLNVNKTVLDKLEYTYEEMINQTILMLYPDENKMEALKIFHYIIEGKTDTCTIPVKTKSGKLIDVETKAKIGTWNGRPAVFGVAREMTEFKRSMQLFYTTFFSSTSAMGLTDPETGRFYKVNGKFLEMTGYTIDEVIGKSSLELFDYYDANLRKKLINEVVEKGFFDQVELKIRSKKNKKIIYGLFSGKFIDYGGSKYLYTIFHDITEKKQKEYEEALINKVLIILNNQADHSNAVKEVLQIIKEYAEVEAIGIRVKDKNDYPFFEVLGFEADFVEKECFQLCKRDNSTVCNVTPINYACICGRVVSKRINNEAPFYTESGSFWTNNLGVVEEAIVKYEPSIDIPKVCLECGYKSVAIIPIYAGDNVIGLLQLNDKKPDVFNMHKILFIEKLCKAIGIAFDKIQTFEALKESESKYRTLIENSQDGVFIVQDDRFVFVNDAFCNILDMPRDEIEGLVFTEILIPELREFAMEQHAKRNRGEEVPNRFTATLINPKTQKRIECKMSVGQIIYHGYPATMGTVHDITEEVKTQEKIKQNEQFLQAVLDLSPLGISVRSNTGKLLLYNKAWQRIWAIPTEAIIKDMTTEREELTLDFRDTYAAEWWEEIKRVYTQGGSLIIPEAKTAGLRMGEAEWISQYFYAIHDNEGKVDRVVIITQDITQRKKSELELKASQEHYKVLVDTIGNTGFGLAMVKMDKDNPIIIFANEQLARIVEYDQSELIGMSIYKMIKPEYQPKVKERLAAPNMGVYSTEVIESEVITKTGRTIMVETHSRITTFNNQEVTVTLIQDVTDRKIREEERLKLSKLETLGILASGISQDFNNLLTSILGYTNLMQLDAPDIYLDYLKNIEKAVQQASRLTHQLLTFAKGSEPVKKLSKIVEIVKRETEFALYGSNITYHMTCNNPWLVNIDPGQIAQVIQNVIINAKQAMPNGGHIDIKIENVVYNEQKYLSIEIKDNGLGIRKEHLSKIFDPYFTTKPTSSGLGLTICHSIIVKHDGKITVNSTPGAGTTVTIWLPATEESEKVSQEVKSSDINYDLSDYRILILDEDPEVKEYIVESLEKLNCEVTAVDKGSEMVSIYAKALASNFKYDLVIIDLTIPESSEGVATLKKLKEIDPEVIAIAISSYPSDPVFTNYRDYGFKSALAKPIDINVLVQTIQQLVEVY